MSKITKLLCLASLAMTLALGFAWSLGRYSDEPRQKLIAYLNGIAQKQLDNRKRAVAAIKTHADAERRQAMVREKILGLIGGLPPDNGPVTVKQFGTLSFDGFRVEKIAYESLPGFWVTANIYVPTAGNGPFPAVVLTPGHGASGKLELWNWGANLARLGILTLAYDPLGEGERLQYYDPDLKASKIGGSTGEHGEANLPMLLLGDQLSRYLIHDARRGVDYLSARQDVDASRIGAFGCSGGGTITAYLAALDSRVKVAVSACYITSFEELLPSRTGVQEAEQSIPYFVKQGMDFPDWVELFAPKPYAIVSTTNDMFPLAGARQTYEEAKHFYALYGAGDRLQWITGPGGHGNLMPIAPAILGFLARYLTNSTAEVSFMPVRLKHRQDLICTPTGQVTTSIGSETVYSLNRQRAETLQPANQALINRADLEHLQARVRRAVCSVTAVDCQPGVNPASVTVTGTEYRRGYRIDAITLRGQDGIDISGYAGIPADGGPHPAVLMMSSWPKGGCAVEGDDLHRLVQSGHVVMVLEPRPTPPGTESIKSPFLGVFNLLSLRAFLVGKTLVGMRIDDAIHAVDWLCKREDVDPAAITAYGAGPLGMVILDAAALDTRIKRVVVEDSVVDYRIMVDQPLHRNISEVLLPGVLRQYDTGDLLLATFPRPVTIINPQDAKGAVVTKQEVQKELTYVFETDQKLGSAQRILIVYRGPREPLPIY